jgi:hypothetical protein
MIPGKDLKRDGREIFQGTVPTFSGKAKKIMVRLALR